MKKDFFTDFKNSKLNQQELLHLKGGRFSKGPGELVDDDIDMPDLSFLSGPGELVDDDIDMPDLTFHHHRRNFTKSFIFQNIF